MPVGPYPDFESCVKAQMSRGYDMETARRICREIERRMRRTHFRYSIGFEPFTMKGGRYVKVKVIDTTTSRPTEPYYMDMNISSPSLQAQDSQCGL